MNSQEITTMSRMEDAEDSTASSKVPFFLLICLLAFTSIRPDCLLFGGRYLAHFPTVLTALLAIFWCMARPKRITNSQTRLFVVLCVIAVLQVPFARNSGISFKILKGILLYQFTLYFFMVQFIDSFGRITKYFRLYIILAAIPAIIGIVHGGHIMNVPILSDENDFCLFANFMIPFAFFMALERDKIKNKLFYLILMIIFILANVATLSRGGFVGLLAVGFYLFLGSRYKFLIIVLVGIVSLLILNFAPPAYFKEIESIDLSSYKRDTGDERISSWKSAWEMFKGHPIIGVGVGNYGPWLPDYWQGENKSPEQMWGRVAHSLYFTLLSEMGLVGTFLFLGMLIGNIRDHRCVCELERNKVQYLVSADHLTGSEKEDMSRKIRSLYFFSKAYFGAMIAYLVTGIFISVLWYSYFWTITAFFVLTGNYARKLKVLLVRPSDGV